MAALNQRETKALRDAIGVIDNVLKNGLDLEKAEAKPYDSNGARKRALLTAKQQINTIVQMKGHYPK